MRFSRILAVLCAVSFTAGTCGIASAAEVDTLKKGDGGIVAQPCGEGAAQIRIDSADASDYSECFALVKEAGWLSLRITGSYGVANNLTIPVAVAFKLPDGAVYWSTVVEPGEIRSIDVNNSMSTVVELQAGVLPPPHGGSTEELAGSKSGKTQIVSFRDPTSGHYLRSSWLGFRLDPLTRNSQFEDRLDAAFVVREGKSDPACFSFELGSSPGTFLMVDTSGQRLVARTQVEAQAATWCPSNVTSPPTGIRLVNQSDQRLVISRTDNTVTVSPDRSSSSVWFVDAALAQPVLD